MRATPVLVCSLCRRRGHRDFRAAGADGRGLTVWVCAHEWACEARAAAVHPGRGGRRRAAAS